MLAARIYTCMTYLVRGTGLEPVSEDWRPSILAANWDSTNEPNPAQKWSERRESNSLGQLGRLELNQ
jgi:hypothetical protein